MTRDQVLAQIKNFEGYSPRASWDYKQYSNGYGTRARAPGEQIDRDEAERRLQSEVDKARATVENFAPNADEGTKAALTSLTFNAGDAWTRSGLGQAIKAGDTPRARELFLQYNHSGGEVNPGLTARRQQEAQWIGAPTTQPEPAQTQKVAEVSPYQPPPVSPPAGQPVASADSKSPMAAIFGALSPSAPTTSGDAGGGGVLGLSSGDALKDTAAAIKAASADDAVPKISIPGQQQLDLSRLRSIMAARGILGTQRV